MATATPTTSSPLTAADRGLLERSLHGFLSIAGGAEPPQPRPVWFELTADGFVQVLTGADSPKVRRLRLDPRASLVVATPVGEPENWVAVSGPTTIETDGAADLCTRLAARYWDLNDASRAAELESFLAADLVRIVIRPRIARRYVG